jgi:hypothetical protein
MKKHNSSFNKKRMIIVMLIKLVMKKTNKSNLKMIINPKSIKQSKLSKPKKEKIWMKSYRRKSKKKKNKRRKKFSQSSLLLLK